MHGTCFVPAVRPVKLFVFVRLMEGTYCNDFTFNFNLIWLSKNYNVVFFIDISDTFHHVSSRFLMIHNLCWFLGLKHGHVESIDPSFTGGELAVAWPSRFVLLGGWFQSPSSTSTPPNSGTTRTHREHEAWMGGGWEEDALIHKILYEFFACRLLGVVWLLVITVYLCTCIDLDSPFIFLHLFEILFYNELVLFFSFVRYSIWYVSYLLYILWTLMICLSATIYCALVTYVATLIGAEMRWVCVCVTQNTPHSWGQLCCQARTPSTTTRAGNAQNPQGVSKWYDVMAKSAKDLYSHSWQEALCKMLVIHGDPMLQTLRERFGSSIKGVKGWAVPAGTSLPMLELEKT